MQEVMEGYKKPDHVPDDLFIAGNIWKQLGDHPHLRMRQLAAGRDIVFLEKHNHEGHSPAGTWLAASAEANRQILLDTESFPSSGATIFGKILGGLTFFPVEVDPPEHGKYRAIIAPFFKPAAMKAMESKIASRVDELIDGFLESGECEFISQFARILPATIFLDLVGLPTDRAADFLDWARTALDQVTTAEDKVAAMRRIRDYLADEVRSRVESPRDDTLSAIANGEIDGRPLTVDEATGGAMVLFLAGLDTVANLLGWIFLQLSTDLPMQHALRDDPKNLSRALEELLRFYSPVTVSRRAAKDAEVCGVQIRQGDTVCCSMTLASRDDKEFENPDKLDLNQPPRRHLVFGYGPHMCIGMHLAKIEARIVIERWFARTGEFRLIPGADVPRRGAGVLGIDQLPLTWR